MGHVNQAFFYSLNQDFLMISGEKAVMVDTRSPNPNTGIALIA
jgi:hypothetical protein